MKAPKGIGIAVWLLCLNRAPATAQQPEESSPKSTESTSSAIETSPPEAAVAQTAPLGNPEDGGNTKLEWKFGGKIQSDLRFRTSDKSLGNLTLPAGVERNRNLLKVKMEAAYGRYAGVVDVDFVWWGIPQQLSGVSDLSHRDAVDPTYLQAHSVYLEASDFLVEGMDLRAGQQLVLWGKGDQFNPTNNVNPNNLEDILLFGEQLGNVMVKLDYTASDWTLSGVLVPVFKPALLPPSAILGAAANDRLPFVDENLRYRLHLEKAVASKDGFPTSTETIHPLLPKVSLRNMQFAFRVAGTLGEQDLALSYYQGFSDMPVPVKNYTVQVKDRACRADEPDCIQNMLQTEASLTYPSMQVLGFNAAGEANLLGWISKAINPIGYRFELAMVFPKAVRARLFQESINLGLTQPAGEYDYGGRDPLVVEETAFFKWVLGLDYTLSRNFYLNLMWVHGMPDEFGAGDFLNRRHMVRQGGVVNLPVNEYKTCAAEALLGGGSLAACGEDFGRKHVVETLRPRIGDYLVFILDFKFLDDKALVRLFAMLDLSGYSEERFNEQTQRRERTYLSLFGDGFSAIVYPEFNYNFGNGLDLGFGALLQLGKDFTKFGDPAAGGSLIWTRARFSY